MNIVVPELSLVLLIGPSGCGKSTFARKHFKPTEVLSSDYCRGLVADDENDQSATKAAFEILHFIAGKRLAAGRLTVIDATNVQRESRKSLLALAQQYHVLPVAIVFDLPEQVCVERNHLRTDRDFGPHVIHTQHRDLLRDLRHLERDGFRYVHILRTVEDVEAAEITRQPLWNNRKNDHGPFDIIGDVHGCFAEVTELLEKLGYVIQPEEGTFRVTHPESRKLILVGDLVDRGPDIPDVLRLAMAMTRSGAGLCVPGNHDMKLLRKLRGRDVPITHGLADSLRQLENEPPAFIEEVREFLDGLVSHYVLDDGKLVVAHAGLKEELQGRGSAAVREFALFGETTGETDEFGLPVRLNWAVHYRGRAHVVYGHTPVAQPEWLNRTINIDTGCVFGGSLTALRYPEKQLVSVPARRTYYEPARPFLPPDGIAPAQRPADLLDINDVSGKRLIETRFHHPVTIREENAAAALEAISRFAVDPRWLIYLPPTMSPPETSQRPGLLEHPDEAFAYYRKQGVTNVICQQKHMGSRVVIVLCRNAAVLRARFGFNTEVDSDALGICYTRTGRPFFSDGALERALLARLNEAMTGSGLWDHLQTDWVCLDAELMPWSQKAQELIQRQYAATGSAGKASLSAAITALEMAASPGTAPLLEQYRAGLANVDAYVEAYRRYCWPVRGLGDLRLAPFHLLASEGQVYAERDHLWHMNTLARLCAATPELLLPTPFRTVDLNDQDSVAGAVQWWEKLTSAGGEGMVVKPLSFLQPGKRGLVQPAVKCRGREYLRLIYGPEYTDPNHLNRLRERNVGVKRSLALREFALGLEALERFSAREPLYRVHECVFGVLALESEPVDPRL